MDIVIENFVLRPCMTSTKRFDIFKVITRTKKEDKTAPKKEEEKYEAEKEFGFSCELENALHIIIMDRLAHKQKVVTPREFLNEYKAERSEILNIIDKQTH